MSLSSWPDSSIRACGDSLKEAITSRESSMSLNMPSSLAVKPEPHSAFSFEIIDFSASTEADLSSSSRLDKSFL